MRRFRGYAFLRCVLLAALVVWLVGCYRWVPVEPPGPALRAATEDESPGRVRLYLTTGDLIAGRLIGIYGDTILMRTGSDPSEQVVSLRSVDRAEFRHTKVLATVLLTIGIIAAPFILYGAAMAIACSGQGEKCLS